MDSMRDAMVKTEAGKTLVIQARECQKRYGELRELVYQTFVGEFCPKGQARFDVFKTAISSRGQVKVLADKGGEDYGRAVMSLKWAWNDRTANRIAIKTVAPTLIA
jgi:hypothetical protein